MNLVKYDEILNNCGARTTFDSYGFEQLLKRYMFNWKNIILQRHYPFVELYIKHKGNMSKISKDIGYPIIDLRAIFLRIQSQFEIYDEDNSAIFVDMVLNVHGLPVITGELNYETYIKKHKQEKQLSLKSVFDNTQFNTNDTNIIESNIIKQTSVIDNDSNQYITEDNDQYIDNGTSVHNDQSTDIINESIDIFTVLNNIETYLRHNSTDKRIDKLRKYGEEFKKLEDISSIEHCLSEKTYKALILLTQGKSLKDISKTLNSVESYLICCILGRNNPRSKTEYGVIELIKQNLYNKSI